MHKVECQHCAGTGVISRRQPKPLGRCSNGEMMYCRVATVLQNTRCEDCSGRGKVEGQAASAVSPAPASGCFCQMERGATCHRMTDVPVAAGSRSAICEPFADAQSTRPIIFGDHEITAPGFDQDGFERAIARALVDEMEIHRDPAGGFIVTHKGVNGGYRTTRHSCSCPAGEHSRPCKHRAALAFHLDVRQPAVRKQWAAARRVAA